MKDNLNNTHHETRHVVIYGYTHTELANIMRHFEEQLPEFVKISVRSEHMVTTVTLTGVDSGLELLRFKMNKYQQQLSDMFSREVLALEDKKISDILGELLIERQMTVTCAESCTGGEIAHRIVQRPGSSEYFLGSVVSYSNEVKANVLGVSRGDLSRYGAVSREVAEQMATGVCNLMKSDCAIATTGIAGPDGGSKFKPVGTVWFAVKIRDRIVSECVRFEGNRDMVIESATNHAMVMLIRLLRDSYTEQDEIEE